MREWPPRLSALELLLAMPLVAEVRSLTILPTNDLSARVTALDDGHGGLAALASVIRKERAQVFRLCAFKRG